MAKSKLVTPSTSSKVLVLLLIAVSVAFIISLGARTFGAIVSPDNAKVDKESFQAIRLTDGSVFYGSITNIGQDFIVLSDVYYESADSAHDGSQVSLTQHGTEPYGPSNTIHINRNQVVFWENLKRDGAVTETIISNDLGDGDEN